MGWAVKSRGKYRFKWVERGKVRTRTLPDWVRTRAQARKVAEDWSREIKDLRRRSAIGTAWTVSDARREVLATADYSPRNRKNVDLYWDRIEGFFGSETPLAAIGKREILDWVSSLRGIEGRGGRKVKNSTLRHYYFTLSKAFALALESDALDSNPFDRINVAKVLPDDTGSRTRRISEEEFLALLDQAVEDWTRTFLVLAWSTGARMSEITGLDWADIDLERRVVSFRHNPERGKRTKNKKDREATIGPEAAEYLRERSRSSGWVIARGDGSRVADVSRGVERSAERAGLSGVSTHILRHSVGSHLIASGTSPVTVRDLLGHSDLRVTSRYSHSSDREREEAAQNLDATLKSRVSRDQWYKKTYTREEIREVFSDRPDDLSLIERAFSVLERETGLEPATLSLEGRERGRGPSETVEENRGKYRRSASAGTSLLSLSRIIINADWYKKAYTREVAA